MAGPSTDCSIRKWATSASRTIGPPIPSPASARITAIAWKDWPGPAIEARWRAAPDSLPPDHPAWELEAHYLALGLMNWLAVLSPRRIVMGGGVMRQSRLFPLVRRKLQQQWNRYVPCRELLEEIDSYIVPPRLGERAGVLGALVLAEAAASAGSPRTAV
ncbi:MAG TPA: ROK family protein [Bryobacteraceae bacterium]|nr:ROK family protein [Bryobacteraceae bacterium]